MSKSKDINDEVVSFDRYKLENELRKNNGKIYKVKENVIFSLLPDKRWKHNEKYYVNIKNKKEQYIGVLTNVCKKELFGYILFNQDDEYLGQISNEKKNGFGIYKFNDKTYNKYDIYIGEFFENVITGEGIYINILKIKDIEKEKDKTKLLKQFICSIGKFENGAFKKGKIYSVDDKGYEKLEFKDYEREENDKEKKECFNFEKKNDIYIYSKGINKEKKLNEGSVIYIKEDGQIENKFTFELNKELNYDFKYLEDETIEKELLEEFQNSNFAKYNSFVQNLFKQIEKLFYDIKNDEELQFGKELITEDKFKKYFSDNYDSLIK